MRRWMGIIFLVFLLFWIGFNPNEASDVAENAGGVVEEWFTGAGQFLANLARS